MSLLAKRNLEKYAFKIILLYPEFYEKDFTYFSIWPEMENSGLFSPSVGLKIRKKYKMTHKTAFKEMDLHGAVFIKLLVHL